MSLWVHVQTLYQCIRALTDDVVLRTEGLNNRLVSVATKPLDNHLGKEDKSDRLNYLSLIPCCLQLKSAWKYGILENAEYWNNGITFNYQK